MKALLGAFKSSFGGPAIHSEEIQGKNRAGWTPQAQICFSISLRDATASLIAEEKMTSLVWLIARNVAYCACRFPYMLNNTGSGWGPIYLSVNCHTLCGKRVNTKGEFGAEDLRKQSQT